MQKAKEYVGVIALALMVAVLLMGVASNRYPDSHGQSLTGPATGVVTVTQSDSAELDFVARSLIAESAGTITYKCVDDTTGVTDVVAGQQINCQIKQVLDTGTTLTDAQMTGLK